MESENSDLVVHAVIGRLFEEPEPTHRANLADGAIAQGMAANRRRGFAVAGATLSVLAVVAGAATVAGGPGGGSWSLGTESANVSPQAYEDAGPTYADRQREIAEELPGVLGPLLPAGMTVRRDPRLGNDSMSFLTGDFSPAFAVESGGTEYALQIRGDDGEAAAAFAKASVKPVAVTGGSIRMTVPANDSTKGPVYYEFTPTDAAAPPVRFVVFGFRAPTPFDSSPIDATAFKKMVEAPGFAKLRQLLDPSVQASAAAVRKRYTIEAKINAEAGTVLPPGFRLKLSPGAPGELELVGPNGVNAFEWHSFTGPKDQIKCPAEALCFVPSDRFQKSDGFDFQKTGPDGKARLGMYAGWVGKSTDSSVTLSVFGKPHTFTSTTFPDMSAIGKPVETAPQGPGLTPQEARAIIEAPGLPKVIADVQKLVALT
ncbi:MAG: hypothetical protein AUG49_26170 [Catenulispora sp. 13_1_20CM_3_70_7]|nr:MAG: hypothetical protein AUG49_26170 [Catenulispora sp. 13_1_20CM_3_70_7]